MANFTGQRNDASILNEGLSAPPAAIAEFFSALNIFLSITASLGNALIIIALKNVPSIHPPTKLFFRCLAVTDLCVGVIVQPLVTTYIMSRVVQMNMEVLFYVYTHCIAFGRVLCGVSVLTSTAISVDRLLALLLGLRYRHVVTLRRTGVVVTCFWLISSASGWIWVWRSDIATKEVSVTLVLCLAISIFCYTKIHLKLRQHQTQIHNVPQRQPNEGGIPLNIARYKKTVSSTMWVQLALVACYAPFGIVAGLHVNRSELEVVWIATSTLVYLNSSLNPILYCWKLGEVKQAVKGTVRQLTCF